MDVQRLLLTPAWRFLSLPFTLASYSLLLLNRTLLRSRYMSAGHLGFVRMSAKFFSEGMCAIFATEMDTNSLALL